MDKEKILQRLNLSPSESRAYLSLLSAGPVKVAELCKLINTTKMTGYLAADALLEKGLISITERNGIKYAQAENPDRLVLRLKEQQAHLSEEARVLGSLLPELNVLFKNSETKPSVKVFHGLEGLKSVYENLLKTMKRGDSFVAFGSIEEAFSVLGDYLKDFIARRVERQISFRGIAPLDPLAKTYQAKDKAELREVRLISRERYPFVNEIDIYGQKVAILSFKDQIGLVIESPQISQTLKAIFELSWDGLALK